MPPLAAFLLTSSFRDTPRGFEMVLHALCDDGVPLCITVDTFRPMFFVPRSCPPALSRGCKERRKVELCTFGSQVVDCLYFSSWRALRDTAQHLHRAGIPTFESDVNPVDRFLMERGIKGGFVCEGEPRRTARGLTMRNPRMRAGECVVAFRVLSLDIETSVERGCIYSVALHGAGADVVFIAGKGEETPGVVWCAAEQDLLGRFVAAVDERDPDIIIGWNVVDFDLRVLHERCTIHGVPFALGRAGLAAAILQRTSGRGGQCFARIPGRMVMDTIVMLRAYYPPFEEYSLAHVATVMLGRTKMIESSGQEKIAEIERRFRDDPLALARYNLEDAALTKEIFDMAGLLPNAVARSRLSGLAVDRTGGSVAAFDYVYLPLLHRSGYVAGNVADTPAAVPLPGGYVMEPAPGVYDNVVVLDFKSLYPTIIMTFCIDPLGFVHPSADRITGPSGRSFAREPSLLPGIIATLISARSQARREENPYLAQAIKILMNSFYGVLGTPGCRFFSPELAKSITESGQYILRQTCNYIELEFGYRVIYGDTDSLFVHLGPNREAEGEAIGRRIAGEVTQWLGRHLEQEFGTSSRLDLEFEALFHRFLLPSVRGGGAGSKKHYCGAIRSGEGYTLHFKGMESVRTDWTPLAREFQHELCRRLFMEEPLQDYIRSVVAGVVAGRFDNKLIYRKRLRKNLNEYTGPTPPHVQAARQEPSPGSVIRYLITTQGPQPVGRVRAPVDYRHYIDCQLKPVAETILEWTAGSFEQIVDGQQNLFDAC